MIPAQEGVERARMLAAEVRKLCRAHTDSLEPLDKLTLVNFALTTVLVLTLAEAHPGLLGHGARWFFDRVFGRWEAWEEPLNEAFEILEREKKS